MYARDIPDSEAFTNFTSKTKPTQTIPNELTLIPQHYQGKRVNKPLHFPPGSNLPKCQQTNGVAGATATRIKHLTPA
ncbi:hypothetical protein J6590_097154 [Homalodisca vitripennis]|nr:hypothetical protein J6590_097154 [Homalodisca vitripennis]